MFDKFSMLWMEITKQLKFQCTRANSLTDYLSDLRSLKIWKLSKYIFCQLKFPCNQILILTNFHKYTIKYDVLLVSF